MIWLKKRNDYVKNTMLKLVLNLSNSIKFPNIEMLYF
jgi:hypothetical protein